MDDRLRVFIRDVLTYGVGGLVNGLIRVALIPIISRYLQPDSLGVYSLLMMVVSFLYIIFDMGFSYALMKCYSESEDPDTRSKAGGTALLAMAVGGGILFGMGLLCSAAISRTLLGGIEHASLVRLAMVIALFSSFFQVQLSILRASGRPRGFVLFTAIRGLSNVLFTMALVMVASMGIRGFMWGMCCSFALAIGAFVLLKRPRLTISRDLLARMWRYGLPLAPSNLAIWFLTYADIYLLKTLKGLREVGLYQFAQELCIPITLLLVSFERGWPHFIFSRSQEHDSGALFQRVLTMYVAACVLVGLALAMFRRELLALLSAAPYLDSAEVFPLLLCSGILYGAFYIFGTGLLLSGKTYILPCITLAAAVLNVLLNLAFIPPYGIVGAGWATVLTNIVMAAATLVLAGRHYPLRFHFTIPCLITGIGLVAYMGVERLQGVSSAPFLVKIVVLLTLGVVMSRLAFRTERHTGEHPGPVR